MWTCNPVLRMPYREAMDRFGSDKPDLRFGFELTDISDPCKDCGFAVFHDAVAAGGSVRLINLDGHATDFPARRLTSWRSLSRPTGQGSGLDPDGGCGVTSSYAKFLTEEENKAILDRGGAKDGIWSSSWATRKMRPSCCSLGRVCGVECAKRLWAFAPG